MSSADGVPVPGGQPQPAVASGSALPGRMRQELAAASSFSSSCSPSSGSGSPGPGPAVALLRAPRAPRPPPDALLDTVNRASSSSDFKVGKKMSTSTQEPQYLVTWVHALRGHGNKLSSGKFAKALPQVSLGRKIKTFATKMVITSGNDEDRGGQEKESKEESVLAMLGIIGTILNLIVIIFVYIYTTL